MLAVVEKKCGILYIIHPYACACVFGLQIHLLCQSENAALLVDLRAEIEKELGPVHGPGAGAGAVLTSKEQLERLPLVRATVLEANRLRGPGPMLFMQTAHGGAEELKKGFVAGPEVATDSAQCIV